MNVPGSKKRVGKKVATKTSLGTSNSDFNKKRQINVIRIDAQDAGTNCLDLNKKTGSKDSNVAPEAADKIKDTNETSTIRDPSTVAAPLGDKSVCDMSLFESDTPGKRSGTHVQTVSMASKVKPAIGKNFGKQLPCLKSQTSYDISQSDTPANKCISNIVDCGRSEKVGKKGSVDYNTVNFKRMEYIRNQQKDPRSAAYLKSRNSKFGYQEVYSETPKSGFNNSLSGRHQTKEGYSVHSKSFGNSSYGKSHSKKGNGMHSFSNGSSSAGESYSKKGNGMHTSSIGSGSSDERLKDRIIIPIRNVNPMATNMAIKGRCVSIWHSHKLNEEHDPYSLDCVFQDLEDNRIQIYIKKELMFKFEPLLQEGQCYILSNFGVAENGGRLPLLPNRWKLSFFKGTNVTRVEQINDNVIGFIYEPFSRILDPVNEYHDHDCVDVIGTVVAIGKIVGVNNHGGSKIRRTIVIEDAESYRLECTFWDNWALMWNDYENRLEEIGHIDILLMLGKVKYWDNKPAVHNALFGSRIFINRKIPPLLLFRKRYESQEGYNANEFKIQLHNQEKVVVTPAEFMHGCLKSFVGMIRSIEPDTCCVVFATVHSIQYENGWTYTACKECNTRVTTVSSKGGMNNRNKKQLWFCKKHGETYVVASRFKIIVRIVDDSGTAQVVLFDNNVHKMINLSAWQIMDKHGMDPEEYFPDEINQIIGKQYLFKIKYSEFNHSNNSHIYRTEKVTDDVDTIMYFKNGFLDEEDIEDVEYNMKEFSDNANDVLHNNDGDLDDNVDEFVNAEDDSDNDEADSEKEDYCLNSDNVSDDNEHDIEESFIGEEDLDTPHVDIEDGSYDLSDLEGIGKNAENHLKIAENLNTKSTTDMEENVEINTPKSAKNASSVVGEEVVVSMIDPVGVLKKRNRGIEELTDNDCVDEEDVQAKKKMQTYDIEDNDA